MSTLIILVRILFSALLSGLVGIEREIHGRAAGLRTHILVGVGSTLFMITSILVGSGYGTPGSVDASRIAAQVVTGIGFLGAGAIIRSGGSIRGLTTAASIWAMAAIGLAVGAGLYSAAGITAAVVLAVLILSRWEERMELKQGSRKLTVHMSKSASLDENDIRDLVEAYGGRIKLYSSTEDEKGEEVVISVNVTVFRGYYREILSELNSVPGVKDVNWQ